MHASEHERTSGAEEHATEPTVEHHDAKPALRFGLGSIPPVQAQVSKTAGQQSASEQAYGGDAGEALAAIQGEAMFALLPSLEKLPAEALDDRRALSVGGTRLLLAVRAVKAKRGGADIHQFVDAFHDQLAEFPPDQLADIKAYLIDRKPAAATTASTTTATASTATASTATETMPAKGTLDASVTGLPIDAPLINGTFLGQPVRAHPVLLARLRLAEDKLSADLGLTGAALAKDLGVNEVYKVVRNERRGYHPFGLAIDINYMTNPDIGGQKSGGGNHKGGDEEAMAAIWRACWLTGDGDGVSPGDSQKRFKNVPGSTGELWNHLHKSDQALRKYLGAAHDEPQVAAWLAKSNLAHVPPTPQAIGFPVAALDQSRLTTANSTTWLAQIQADLEVTHGRTATGSNWWMTGANQRSDLGFLNLDRRLVIALREVANLAWGAADFDGDESGDMMHFDCRRDYHEDVMNAAHAAGKSNLP